MKPLWTPGHVDDPATLPEKLNAVADAEAKHLQILADERAKTQQEIEELRKKTPIVCPECPKKQARIEELMQERRQN